MHLTSHSTYISDHQLHTREVSAQMESRIVKTVLSTGVDRQRVMQVIERRLRETGKGTHHQCYLSFYEIYYIKVS